MERVRRLLAIGLVALLMLPVACAVPDARRVGGSDGYTRQPFESEPIGAAAGSEAVAFQTAPTVDDAAELPPVSTFSIVALDPETGDLGVCVTSKFLAVGSVVPFAEAGVGAVATQAWANVTYGPRILDLLREGKTAAEAIAEVTGDDRGAAQRQVGVVDAHGRAATFTGDRCMDWAGGRTGRYCAVQGNILVDEVTVDTVIKTFERSEGSLARRMVNALLAGYRAGGDKRSGPSNPLDLDSAALLVVRANGGYSGGNDRFIDLRIDNQKDPVVRLGELLDLHERVWRPYHQRRPRNPIQPIDPDKPQTPETPEDPGGDDDDGEDF